MSTLAPSNGEGRRTMSPGGRLGIGLALLTALALVAFGVVAAVRAGRPSRTANVETPQVVSMEEAGRTMQQAATTMQGHAQAMLDEGRRTGNQDLIAHGEHWLREAADLNQAGGWMLMNPVTPGALAPQANLTAADRSQLDRAVRAMIHDPSKVGREVDLETLRWNGLSLRGEGQNMADHARVMAEEVELMVERHGLQAPAAADLRAGTAALRQGGDHLMQNGQAMIDYADRLRRGMGLK